VRGKLGFTATISLDAHNGYEPDKLVLKGNGSYTGSIDTSLLLEKGELEDISDALEKVSLSSSLGEGQGFELSAELDLEALGNLAATLRALTSQGQDALPLVEPIAEKGTIGFDIYDLSTEEAEGSVKIGVGVGAGGGGSATSEAQSGRSGYVRPPGGTFEARVCEQAS